METTQQPDEEPEEPWLGTKACEGQESSAEKKEHTQQTVRDNQDNVDTHTFTLCCLWLINLFNHTYYQQMYCISFFLIFLIFYLKFGWDFS